MKKNNPYEKNIQKNCVVCSAVVMVDQFGHGECDKCSWYQNRDDLDSPEQVVYPSMISLNKARQLIKEGKALKPTFDEFIGAWLHYGETQFDYKGRTYGLLKGHQDKINFYEWEVKDSIQIFNTIEEFRESAHINGVLLKDIWHQVEKADYMS